MATTAVFEQESLSVVSPMPPSPRGEVVLETITLDDGTIVPIRPIRPEDTAALQRFHRRLSERSVRFRFFGFVPELSDNQARYFTHLDGETRFALVALDPNEPSDIVAVIRFDRQPGTTEAEYAAVVADQWQGRGLGLALTRQLINAARQRGIRTVKAKVLPDNARMLNLFRDLGLPEQVRLVGGIEHIEIKL